MSSIPNSTRPPITGYLGIDNGTQGISVIFCNEKDLEILATGEASFDMLPDLAEGCFEQATARLGCRLGESHESNTQPTTQYKRTWYWY